MQIEQAHRISHRRPAPADLDRDVLLAHPKLFGQPGISPSFFNWIEIGALKIFYERYFKNLQVGGMSDDYRDLRQPCFLGRPPAPFARDQFVASVGRPHDEGLQDPVLPNGVDQFLQGIAPKFFPGLKRAGSDAGETDVPDLFVRIEFRSGDGTRSDECAQTFTEGRLGHGWARLLERPHDGNWQPLRTFVSTGGRPAAIPWTNASGK